MEAVDVPACAYCPSLYANEVMDGRIASSLPSPLLLCWPVSIAPFSRCLPWTLSNIINHWTTHAHGHKGPQRVKEGRGQGRAAVLTPIAIQDWSPKCTVRAEIWKCSLKSQYLLLNFILGNTRRNISLGFVGSTYTQHIPFSNSTIGVLNSLFLH